MRRPRLTDKRMEGMVALALNMENELENGWLEQFASYHVGGLEDPEVKQMHEYMMAGINYIYQLEDYLNAKLIKKAEEAARKENQNE